MIILLLIHIIITVSCLWAGFIFSRYILKNNETKPLAVYAVNGLMLFTLIGQLLVLFMPVNFNFFLAVFLLLSLIAVLRRKLLMEFIHVILKEILSIPLYAKILLGLLWVMILVFNAGPVIMDDTGSYHIQMIKWIQEFGSVPGIANLHERFGFNSSWFTSIAAFTISPGTLYFFTGLNGILSLWFCYYIISSMFRQEEPAKKSSLRVSLFIVLVLSLLVWPMIRGNATNTNYDFITTTLIFILFLEVFIKGNDFSLRDEWIIWPAYLFTVRIINYPLLILGLFSIYFFIKSGKWKHALLLLTCSFLLVVPFLIRNLIASGYIFYPAPYFDFFNVDWKADLQQTKQLMEFIKYYNRVNTTFMDLTDTKALGPHWVSQWFRHLYMYDKIILFPGLAGLVLGSLLALRKLRDPTPYKILLITALLFIVSWFIIAPDPRFIYGWLLAGSFLLSFHILRFLKEDGLLKKSMLVLFLSAMTGIGFYTAKKIVREPGNHNWINPAALPRPPVQEVIVDGLVLRIPEKINNNWNPRCYGTPLPCLYWVDPRLRARGTRIINGFHLQK